MSLDSKAHLIHLFLGFNHAFFCMYSSNIFNGLVMYKNFLHNQHLLFLWKCFKNKVLQMSSCFFFFFKKKWMALKDICPGSLFKDERNESQENRKKMASRERSVWWIWNCKEYYFCFPRQSCHIKSVFFMKRRVLPRVSQIYSIEYIFPKYE